MQTGPGHGSLCQRVQLAAEAELWPLLGLASCSPERYRWSALLGSSQGWGECWERGPRWEPLCDRTSLLLGDFLSTAVRLAPPLTLFILWWVQFVVVYFPGASPVLGMETACPRSSNVLVPINPSGAVT